MAARERNSAASIKVVGAKELRAQLRQMTDTGLLKEVGKAHRRIGEMVIAEARSRAHTKIEHAAASRLRASSSTARAQLVLGGKPYDLGAEFGAYRNLRRLEKNTGGRRTIVREGEDINRVIAKVQGQTVMYDRRGAPTTVGAKFRKYGATAVKVTKVVRGWNWFQPWRGNDANAGYFLFPALRSKREEIIEQYAQEIERLWGENQ